MKVRIGGLGKGLEALLPINDKLPGDVPAHGAAILPLDAISANPNQPRKTFDSESLEELADTIRKNGVLQPIVVEDAGDGRYIVIAGERRLRAARIAGLAEIPVVIKHFSAEEGFLISILENLQREDLNPIEEAAAFKQYMELTGLNQDAVAARVGKNRATVANALRLLKLPAPMREALMTSAMSAGHARALLSVNSDEGRDALFKEIIANSLSVRAAEERAKEFNKEDGPSKGESGERPPRANKERDPELSAIEERFLKALGTKVLISGGLSSGVIKIEYYTREDLDRLCEIIK